jgi:hypothetical protein
MAVRAQFKGGAFLLPFWPQIGNKVVQSISTIQFEKLFVSRFYTLYIDDSSNYPKRTLFSTKDNHRKHQDLSKTNSIK